MRKFLVAAMLLLASFGASAGYSSSSFRSSSFSSSRSFSSSSFRSSSFRSSGSSFRSSGSSYRSPTRSYTAPSRPTSTFRSPARAAYSAPSVSRSVRNTTVVNNHTTVVHAYPSYGFYHPLTVFPVYVHHPYAYNAFHAILAWEMLSAAQRAHTPMPPQADLMDLTEEELSRAIWADGKMTLAEVRAYNRWKELHGGVH